MTTQERIAPPPDELPRPPEAQLVRAIGPWALGMNALNSAVGAGIFVLPGLVAAMLGTAAILAYLICGLALALVLTCFVEIGSFVKRSGGAVAYVEEAFGPLMGFLAWLLHSVGFSMFADAALAIVFVNAVASVLPVISHGAGHALASFVLFGGLAAINIVGVRQGVRFAVATTVAKLLPLLFLIVAGVFLMHWRELRWTGWPTAAHAGEASLLLFIAFEGIEDALTPSGEIRDPARTVPRAIFGATAALILLYVALQAVSQGVLGSDLAFQSTQPLAAVAGRIIGTAGRTLILVGVFISIFGALAGGMLTTPRAFFLVAQDGMLPAALARVHPRFRTPYVAILTVAVLKASLAASGEFKFLAVLSGASTLSVYLAICLGALRLRYTRKRQPGAFRAPGGPTIGILGAVVVVWLLCHSTRVEIGALGGTVLLGTAYYLVRQRILLRRGGRAALEHFS